MKRKPDLFGAGGIGRVLNVHHDTAKNYARAAYALSIHGILRADNGRYYATTEGLRRLKRLAT